VSAINIKPALEIALLDYSRTTLRISSFCNIWSDLSI